jgi:hypothetical protein
MTKPRANRIAAIPKKKQQQIPHPVKNAGIRDDSVKGRGEDGAWEKQILRPANAFGTQTARCENVLRMTE